MTDRIPHRDDAIDLLADVVLTRSRRRRRELIAAAQVHATLYAAERIDALVGIRDVPLEIRLQQGAGEEQR